MTVAEIALASVVVLVVVGVILLVVANPRRKVGTEVERVSPAPANFGGGSCSLPRCPKTEGWLCVYRDKTGKRCDSRWCADHVVVVGKGYYCQRHAAVVKALQQTEGSILQVKSQPSLDDRAVPLLNLICGHVDPAVLDGLRQIVAGRTDVQVARQKSVQEVFVDNERAAWQVAYGINNSRGYLLKVALRVGVSEPPVVQAVVANHVVFQEVPYWIRRRIAGEPAHPEDHERFYAEMVTASTTAIRHWAPDVARQLAVETEKFSVLPVDRY